ncbi:MAG: hypothetical protein J5I81_11870 [Nitrococcus mobilis]|nr:hypothetical protein [Nitrococcus mobilis]
MKSQLLDFNPDQKINLPLEEILSSGADHRSLINSKTGFNKYWCAYSPLENVIPFGSCTASSVSPVGYSAMQEMHERFLAVGPGKALRKAISENNNNLRREIISILTYGLVPGVELALMPSGTDAELLALYLAAGRDGRKICNILIAPTEVGSGTLNAASCLHFDKNLPSGNKVTPGDPVDQQLADRTELHKISIRNASGATKNPDEIDQEIIDKVKSAVNKGKKVLLHMIAHSKTGVHAPSLKTIEMLHQRYKDNLVVVVDAAQGRFSRRGLIKALNNGYLVIITGSKFFGGAFFSGGLLIPPQLHPAKLNLKPLPMGFNDYITNDQLPASWQGLCANTPENSNLGLSLRWVGALAEIRNYYLTPSELRLKVLRAFENMLPAIFGSSPYIQLKQSGTPIIDNQTERFLQSKTTVFSFSLRKTLHAPVLLNHQELSDIFKWLNFDVSNRLADSEPEIRRSLAPRHHIGQPVWIGSPDFSGPSVLRIAIGSVLIARIASDIRYGSTLEQRINWLEDQLISLKRKIETLTCHFDKIKKFEELSNRRI